MEKQKELTPEQNTAATLLAARAANFAIGNAKTKFSEAEQKKIYGEALRRYRAKAMAEAGSRDE